MIKKNALLCLCLFLTAILWGQSTTKLSLAEAYSLLEKNYPALQNAALLEQIHQKELVQLDIALLPDLSVKADGRLMSESVSLETNGAPLPFEIDRPLFSVKSYAEAQYQIMDGGFNKLQRKLKAVQLKADLQNIEVEKFALRKRINQLFSGINLLREQSKLFNISLKDLQARKEQVAAGVAAGLVLESELTKIEVRELELKAQQSYISFQLSGFVKTLAQLINLELPEDIQLVFPQLTSPEDIPDLQRPEQKLFQLQRAAILAKAEMTEVLRKPKLTAYAQAGFGYPNPLNILDNNLAPFGVLGIQFNWKITDWKKGNIDKELLNLQAQKLNNAEASFKFNIEAQEAQYLAELQKLFYQIEQDKKITQLQTQILQQLSAQLDGGIITSADYLNQVNTELLARQNLLINQVNLQKIQLDFWNERAGF